MRKIDIKALDENFIRNIGFEYMLVCSGSRDSFNMMTASWGGVGFVWNRPCAFVMIRPERYTYKFMEENPHFTLSFLGENRHAYTVCGTKSGRDTDKAKEASLTPLELSEGAVSFVEARLALVCRKIYADGMRPDCFLDESVLSAWYGGKRGGFHKLYIAEILSAYAK